MLLLFVWYPVLKNNIINEEKMILTLGAGVTTFCILKGTNSGSSTKSNNSSSLVFRKINNFGKKASKCTK